MLRCGGRLVSAGCTTLTESQVSITRTLAALGGLSAAAITHTILVVLGVVLALVLVLWLLPAWYSRQTAAHRRAFYELVELLLPYRSPSARPVDQPVPRSRTEPP